MDGVTVSVLGALAALVVAIVLILKKVQPTYAMLIGAVAGGLIGGAGLTGTVNYIISGTQGIVSAIIRIVTAGILAGALIESGAAERIAEAIMNKLGAKRCLIAITLATWVLTAVGVFGDVACITVAPIALQMAKRAGYHKMGVLMAQLGRRAALVERHGLRAEAADDLPAAKRRIIGKVVQREPVDRRVLPSVRPGCVFVPGQTDADVRRRQDRASMRRARCPRTG